MHNIWYTFVALYQWQCEDLPAAFEKTFEGIAFIWSLHTIILQTYLTREHCNCIFWGCTADLHLEHHGSDKLLSWPQLQPSSDWLDQSSY